VIVFNAAMQPNRGKRQEYMPTPAEIAATAAQIRSRWGDSEFYKRAGRRPRFAIPVATDPGLSEFR
jgi:hypothetical protein